MTAPTPPTLSAVVRHWLGIDHLEELMATAKEQLEDLSARFDDFTADVRAALATLTAERENLSADAQAALDTLSAKLAAADAEVGDADGSDTPPVEPTP
jgi:ABC-type transporter Mla subunit MlaD